MKHIQPLTPNHVPINTCDGMIGSVLAWYIFIFANYIFILSGLQILRKSYDMSLQNFHPESADLEENNDSDYLYEILYYLWGFVPS